jgi:hypothetical protein
MSKKYPFKALHDGWQTDSSGEEYFYIANPALGLWAVQSRFETDRNSISEHQTTEESVPKKQKTGEE